MTERRIAFREIYTPQASQAVRHFFGLSEAESIAIADQLANHKMVRLQGPIDADTLRRFLEYCETAGYLYPK